MRFTPRSDAWKRYLPLLLLLALGSCRSSREAASNRLPAETPKASRAAKEEAPKEVPQSATKIDTKDKPKPIAPALKPGQYCYQLSNKVQDVQARLTVAPNDQVRGNVQGTIHNEPASYSSSYRTTLDGTIDGSNLNLDVATWIAYDQQNTQETWRVSPDQLSTRQDTLINKSCDLVNKAFQDENGLEAKDLTEGANHVETEVVYFDVGKRSTSVTGSVVRGDRARYTLTARGSQTMALSITSLADNAAFDVVDPSGIILGTGLTKEKIFLPHTGDYQIIVGGTRGNASYDLAIAIE